MKETQSTLQQDAANAIQIVSEAAKRAADVVACAAAMLMNLL